MKAIDLFTVFSTADMDKLGKSVDTDWREHLNISQTALFESDTSYKVSKDIFPQQLRKFTDVSMVRGKLLQTSLN